MTLTPDTLRVVTGARTGVGVRFLATRDTRVIDEVPAAEPLGRADHTDFALGRAAADDALGRLGEPRAPIPVGASGEPVWPDGIVGSISHTPGLAIAIVGRREEFLGIGVDVELAGRNVDERTFARICTPAELEWVRAGPDPKLRALMLFCAKEATYKALSGLGGSRLGFHDVEFVSEDVGVLEGRLRDDASPGAPRRVAARMLVSDGFVISCVLVPAEPG